MRRLRRVAVLSGRTSQLRCCRIFRHDIESSEIVTFSHRPTAAAYANFASRTLLHHFRQHLCGGELWCNARSTYELVTCSRYFQLEVNPAGLHRDLVVHAPIIVGSIPLCSTFQDFIGEKREDVDTPLQMYPELGEKLFHVTSSHP